MAWHLKPQANVSLVCCGNSWYVFLARLSFLALAGPGPLHLDVRHWLWKSLEDVVLHSIAGTFRSMPTVCSFDYDRWLRCTHYNGQGLIWSAEFDDVQCL